MKNELDRSRLSKLQLVFLDYLEKWLDTVMVADWQMKRLSSRSSYSYSVDVKPTDTGPSSFTVAALAEQDWITVFLDQWHEHFSPAEEKRPVDEMCKSAIGLMNAALTGQCKIVVKKASGMPYKWSLYFYEDGKWKFDSTTGLLFYNYLGRRSAEELINKPESSP